MDELWHQLPAAVNEDGMEDGDVQNVKGLFLHLKNPLKKSFKIYVVRVDIFLTLLRNCVNAQQVEAFHMCIKKR